MHRVITRFATSVVLTIGTLVAVSLSATAADKPIDPKIESGAPSTDGPLLPAEEASGRVNSYAKSVGAVGISYDEVTNRLAIRLPKPPPSVAVPAAPRTIDIEGTPAEVRYSRATSSVIDEIRRALTERSWRPDAKRFAYGIYYDATSDTVGVDTDAPRDVMQPLLDRFPELITYHFGPAGRDSRQYDVAPHFGGATIGRSPGDDWCTSGFTVYSSGSGLRYMTTAGHCFPSILQNYIYVGDATGTARVVGGAADPAVGSAYCRSGQKTYEKCSQLVRGLDGIFCDAAGCTYSLIRYTGPSSTNGDSGAPFYASIGGKVHIRGMHIARSGTTMFAEKWTSVKAGLNVSIVTG